MFNLVRPSLATVLVSSCWPARAQWLHLGDRTHKISYVSIVKEHTENKERLYADDKHIFLFNMQDVFLYADLFSCVFPCNNPAFTHIQPVQYICSVWIFIWWCECLKCCCVFRYLKFDSLRIRCSNVLEKFKHDSLICWWQTYIPIKYADCVSLCWSVLSLVYVELLRALKSPILVFSSYKNWNATLDLVEENVSCDLFIHLRFKPGMWGS